MLELKTLVTLIETFTLIGWVGPVRHDMHALHPTSGWEGPALVVWQGCAGEDVGTAAAGFEG